MPRKRKKMVPMKYPVGHEYAYRNTLLTYNYQFKKALKKHMSPMVPVMVAEVTEKHLPTGKIRQDAWDDELRQIMQRIADDMFKPYTTAVKEMTAIGPKVNQYNKEEWRKLIRSQYGVDPTKEDPQRWNDILKNWSRNNALLIKDIPTKTMLQIEDQTREALTSGLAPDDMTSSIYDIMSERTDVSDSRARLIARDQVAKLNGQFTMERQLDLGIDSYTWRTVGDERVRETHASVDGETFPWDSPPTETDGNHPGEDYQCRCWAEPILPDVVDFQASLLEEDTTDTEVDTEEVAA